MISIHHCICCSSMCMIHDLLPPLIVDWQVCEQNQADPKSETSRKRFPRVSSGVSPVRKVQTELVRLKGRSRWNRDKRRRRVGIQSCTCEVRIKRPCQTRNHVLRTYLSRPCSFLIFITSSSAIVGLCGLSMCSSFTSKFPSMLCNSFHDYGHHLLSVIQGVPSSASNIGRAPTKQLGPRRKHSVARLCTSRLFNIMMRIFQLLSYR